MRISETKNALHDEQSKEMVVDKRRLWELCTLRGHYQRRPSTNKLSQKDCRRHIVGLFFSFNSFRAVLSDFWQALFNFDIYQPFPASGLSTSTWII